jgi:hypothetical protein
MIQTFWRPLSVVYDTANYGRNTIATKRQFTAIYDCKLYKTTVYIIVYDCLDDCIKTWRRTQKHFCYCKKHLKLKETVFL